MNDRIRHFRERVENCDLDTSIPDWIIDQPESTAVFRALGIDTSCEGKSLEYVCRLHGFDPQDVLQRLLNASNQAGR